MLRAACSTFYFYYYTTDGFGVVFYNIRYRWENQNIHPPHTPPFRRTKDDGDMHWLIIYTPMLYRAYVTSTTVMDFFWGGVWFLETMIQFMKLLYY